MKAPNKIPKINNLKQNSKKYIIVYTLSYSNHLLGVTINNTLIDKIIPIVKQEVAIMNASILKNTVIKY